MYKRFLIRYFFLLNEILLHTIVPKGIALDAWYPIAIKLMKNAVPHTMAGVKNAAVSICNISKTISSYFVSAFFRFTNI